MATELRLQYQGHGSFYAVGASDQAACEGLEQGRTYNAHLTSPRSLSQNRLLWQLCRYAYDHLSGVAYENVEHLRAWALVEAGHSHKLEFPPRSISRAACELLRSQYLYCKWTAAKDGRVTLYTPAETHDMEIEDFSELINHTAAVLVQVMPRGTDPDELIEMAKAAVKAPRQKEHA